MTYRIPTLAEHFDARGSKRILALDGGGLRGIPTLGFLQRIEAILRERHGSDPRFRLCHYFDLVAGTSTGAIIAAALAKGMTVDEVIGHYRRLGREVFSKGCFRKGIIRWTIRTIWMFFRRRFRRPSLDKQGETLYS